MRRWLLVLMILLLPLRGLVGEVMAGQMMQQHLGVAVSAAAAHDCDEHRHAAPAADTHAHAADDSPDCPTCASCQVCSSVALNPFITTTSSERASQPPPQLAQRHPASAEPALAFKPPRG